MSVRTLHYADIAPGLPFHAALVISESSAFSIQAHDHDFAEVMLVLDGTGVHRLNGADSELRPGQIWSLAAADAHSIFARGGKLTYINVAFPVATWEAFRGLAGVDPPTLALVESASLPDLSSAFHKALAAFALEPTDLDLVELFVAISRGTQERSSLDGGPAWLEIAARKMRLEENLFAGLPRLLELCSVSAAHLSRTVRLVYGVTPTDLVNGYRLDHTKTLLATTAEEVEVIAFRCGFNNAPYFYRLFRKFVGMTPREYRRSIRRKVAP